MVNNILLYTITYILLGENMIINYLKSFALTILIIFGGAIITTLLEYFTNNTHVLINILKIITILLSIFIPTFILGKKSERKGYLEGLKYGAILIVLSLILNIIFKTKFNFDIIIYFIIMLVSAMLGSMMGINFKKNK